MREREGCTSQTSLVKYISLYMMEKTSPTCSHEAAQSRKTQGQEQQMVNRTRALQPEGRVPIQGVLDWGTVGLAEGGT